MANHAGPTSRPQPERNNSPSTQATELGAASALRRLIAFLLDLVLVAAFHFIAGKFFVGKGHWLSTAIFFALYHTLSLAVLGGTLGKAVLALRVQTPAGKSLGWGPAFLRSTVGYLASAFLLLGFLHTLFDTRHRGWHDLLFGSEVVQQPGRLSIKQLIRAIDRWTEELDAWQRRVLARFNWLRRLTQLVVKLTGLMTLLTRGLELIGLPSTTPATATGGVAPDAAATATGSAAPGTLGIATSAVAAVVLAVATVVTYEAAAPAGLRPWDTKKVSVSSWKQQGGKSSGNWVVSEDGTSVVQTINGAPTFFVSPHTFIDMIVKGRFKVETAGDDDYIGFVFGYQSPLEEEGDDADDYNFLVFAWKQAKQNTAPEGFSLARVKGRIGDGPFWDHTSRPGFEVLATDFGRGKGWKDNTEYEFELLYRKDRINFSINGEVIFNLRGTFPVGRFGFYNYSQQSVRYWEVTRQG